MLIKIDGAALRLLIVIAIAIAVFCCLPIRQMPSGRIIVGEPTYEDMIAEAKSAGYAFACAVDKDSCPKSKP
jgi:hypothetical protein